jgi:putative methionine-R-sulfoxide reductase with GAF domain
VEFGNGYRLYHVVQLQRLGQFLECLLVKMFPGLLWVGFYLVDRDAQGAGHFLYSLGL